MNSAISFFARAFNLAGASNGADAAWLASPKRTLLECATLALCGLLFSCSSIYPQAAFLGWFGLLPLFLIARGGSVARAAGRGFVWGYFWSLGAFWWIYEIEPFVPFVFAAVIGFFPMLWAMGVPVLERNLLLPLSLRLRGFSALSGFRSSKALPEILLALSLASLWCLQEWLRSWIFTGMPWNYLGATQWRFQEFVQTAEISGVYGMSFVVALVNIGLAMLIAKPARGRLAAPALAVFALLFALLAGAFLEARAKTAPGPFKELNVAVVQCDISQRRRATLAQAQEALDICLELSEGVLSQARKDGRSIDLLVWPETAVPYPLTLVDNSFSIMYRYRLFDMIRAYKVSVLLGSLDYGVPTEQAGRPPAYNSALLIDSSANIVDSYRKEHIVPFGEYVPFGDQFPALNKALGMGRNLKPGDRFNPLEVAPGVYAGTSICYEDIFPYVSRAHALHGANLLAVITNDAWYPKSSEPLQHFANAVLRSVETRLPMFRCGNSNFSVLIDPTGRVVDSVGKNADGSFAPELKTRGTAVFKAKVPLKPRPTFHTLYGNAFVLLCFFICGFGSLLALLNWKEYKSSLLKPFEGESPLDAR